MAWATVGCVRAEILVVSTAMLRSPLTYLNSKWDLMLQDSSIFRLPFTHKPACVTFHPGALAFRRWFEITDSIIARPH